MCITMHGNFRKSQTLPPMKTNQAYVCDEKNIILYSRVKHLETVGIRALSADVQ